MKKILSATFLLATFCLMAKAAEAPKQKEYLTSENAKIHSYGRDKISFDGRSIKVISGPGRTGGIMIDGPWDLSDYRSIRFTLTNGDPDNSAPMYYILTSGSTNQYFSWAGGDITGKLEGHASMAPGETKTIEVFLPAPLPHPEVQKTFRDNWVIGRSRNTPYSYALGLFSYDIDQKAVTSIKIGCGRKWEGLTYTISDIELVKGKKKELPAMMKLGKDEFFPFIDRYGQFKHSTWPAKVKSDKDLEKNRIAEEKDLAAHPGPSGRSKFGGWADGPKLKATGQFRAEKIDGKWWLVDPEGYLFWSHGVVRVTASSGMTPLDGHKFYFEELPEASSPFSKFYTTKDELLYPYYVARNIKETYDFSSANLYRKYGENYYQIFSDLAHKRLHSWGLNTIANSSDHAICLMDRTPYNERVDLASPVEGYPEWPYFEGKHSFWPFVDPFDELFETCVRAHLESERRELEDPWCLGFFVDNEILWGANQDNLASIAFSSAPTSASKRVLINFLIERYHSIDALNKAWGSAFKGWNDLYANREERPKGAVKDLEEFSLRIVRKYFETVRKVYKQIAPNKLYMGCRFAGAPEYVVKIGAEYCDVMSYNHYSFNFKNFVMPDYIDKPVMIGEFHFGSMDQGMFHSGLMYTENQVRRGESYIEYMKSALNHPNIVGTNWHQFSDQATSGRFDGENLCVGFTDVCDTPYPEMVKALRYIGDNMYSIRKK